MRSSSLITHSFLWLSLLTNKIISILLSPKTAKHLQSNLGIELENSIQQTVNSVYSSWTTKATPFLNPLQINHIIDAYQELNEHYDIRICGGFQHQCDYNLLIFSRADPMKVFTTQGQDSSSSSQSNNPLLLSSLTLEESAEYATGIRIVGTSALELFTHRDLLAAIKTDLNLTIESYGDIIMEGPNKAQLVVTPSIQSTLLERLHKVADIPVTATPLPLSELLVKKRSVKEISTVEASLRLDAVVSAGFGLSRSKVMDMIDNGQVLLNWKEIGKAYNVQEGSVLAIYGMGKIEVKQVQETSKGRFKVKLVKTT